MKHASTNREPSQLISLLNTVNKKYFQQRIIANIEWSPPEGSVAVSDDHSQNALNREDSILFEKIEKQVQSGKILKVIPALKHLSDQGHQKSLLLLIHSLPFDSPYRKSLSLRYNLLVSIDTSIPAACYYPQRSLIAIHPFLFDRNAPQFVIRYLIYHECCHQIIGRNTLEQNNNAAHSPKYMKLEFKAPNREKAIQWLRVEGFPTMPLTKT